MQAYGIKFPDGRICVDTSDTRENVERRMKGWLPEEEGYRLVEVEITEVEK